ncbi:MAG TPA: pyridoxal-phosphate dependent enzyme [Thermoanaerobaculia bacterium]|nr:pyridoxal-phosphate dependent enzyme [Thermoanaerobaculia bacterium]
MNVLDAIGNTALVPLKSGVRVKLEMQNPTGSMKDRMAQAMIARPEADGRLKPGDTVVEYTGGTTGASLALVCTVKGYRLRIVTSDAFSQEKRDQMAAFGAELTIIPSAGGNTTKELILEMIATARKYSAEPNTYWTNQLENRDSIAGYYPLGEEIWRQTNGEVEVYSCKASARPRRCKAWPRC